MTGEHGAKKLLSHYCRLVLHSLKEVEVPSRDIPIVQLFFEGDDKTERKSEDSRVLKAGVDDQSKPGGLLHMKLRKCGFELPVRVAPGNCSLIHSSHSRRTFWIWIQNISHTITCVMSEICLLECLNP